MKSGGEQIRGKKRRGKKRREKQGRQGKGNAGQRVGVEKEVRTSSSRWSQSILSA